MSGSSRVGTRISTRVNKLASHKVADRDAIQQVCDHPAARKFMSWLDTVLQDETLTELEHERYEEMCSGQIDDLYSSSEEEVKLPRLRAEKGALEAEVAALQQELIQCQEREMVYSRQYNIISERDQKVRELSGRCSGRCEDETNVNTAAACKVLQHRFEKQVESLDAVIKEHVNLHTGDNPRFLAYHPLEDYIAAELDYTRALTKYSEKLFFPGISRVPGHPHDCALLGTEEEDDKENTKHSNQIGNYRKVRDTVRRVKSTHMARVEERIAEETKLAGNLAKLEGLKSLMGSVGKCGRQQLNEEAQEYSVRCVQKEDKIKAMWQKDCVPLVVQLKNLQDVSILCGNYKLKLARQNYFMSRQDLVISHLLSQLSRQELIQIMLAHEHRAHVESVDTLHEILTHVSHLNKTLNNQIGLVQGEDAIRPIKVDKLCLGTQDRTLNIVTGLLQRYMRESPHNMFHTFEEVEDAVRRMLAEEQEERERGAVAASNVAGVVNQLAKDLEGCEKCLEKGFTSTVEEEDQITKSVQELEHLAISLRDTFNSNSEQIRNSDAVSVARKLFMWFFTDPDKINEVLHGEF